MGITRRKFLGWCTGALLMPGYAVRAFAVFPESLRQKIERLCSLVSKNYDLKVISKSFGETYSREIKLAHALYNTRYEGRLLIHYSIYLKYPDKRKKEKSLTFRFTSDDGVLFYETFDTNANGLDNIIDGEREGDYVAKFIDGFFDMDRCGMFTTYGEHNGEMKALDKEYEAFLDTILKSGKFGMPGKQMIKKE